MPTWSNTKTNLHTTNKKRQLCVLRLTNSWGKFLLGKIEIVNHSFPLSIHILVEVITNQPLKRALSRSNLSLEVIPPSNCPILHEDTISILYIINIINVLMKFKYISPKALIPFTGLLRSAWTQERVVYERRTVSEWCSRVSPCNPPRMWSVWSRTWRDPRSDRPSTRWEWDRAIGPGCGSWSPWRSRISPGSTCGWGSGPLKPTCVLSCRPFI